MTIRTQTQINQELVEAEAKRQYEHQVRTLTDEERLGMIAHLSGIFCFGCGEVFTKDKTICHCENDE